jgi:hypothetical protein
LGEKVLKYGIDTNFEICTNGFLKEIDFMNNQFNQDYFIKIMFSVNFFHVQDDIFFFITEKKSLSSSV